MGRHAHSVEHFYLARDSRGNWNVQWQCPKENKVKRRGCGTKNKDKARAMMPAIIASITNPAPPAAYTVGELIDAYVSVRTARGQESSPTFHYNLTHIRAFFGSYSPSQINDAACFAYRSYRTSHAVEHASAKYFKAPRAVSDGTAVRELSALAGAVSWGRENGWTGLGNVNVSRKRHVRNAQQRYLTHAEAELLIHALKNTPHLALFVRLALATGARMSALLELTWDKITWPNAGRGNKWGPFGGDPNLSPLVIEEIEGKEHMRLSEPLLLDLGHGRGNKRRGTGAISLTNWKLYMALAFAYSPRIDFPEKYTCEHVISFRNKRISTVDLSDAYKRAGIEGANVHTLKHTCCTWLVQAGVSYEKVAKMVGTTARMIEQHYGHWSPEHLATAGDVLSINVYPAPTRLVYDAGPSRPR